MRPAPAPVSTVTARTISATRQAATTIRNAKFHCVAVTRSVNRSTGNPYSQAQGAVSQKSVRKVRKLGGFPPSAPREISLYYPYQTRPDHGMGSWIQAQPGLGAAVEEVSSPGAFGTYPWVDRRRGLTGIIFTIKLAALSGLPNNNIRVVHRIRSEIDRVGLPLPAPAGPLRIHPVSAGRLRLDWSGPGTLQISPNLRDWTALPVPLAPYIENPAQTRMAGADYRVVP